MTINTFLPRLNARAKAYRRLAAVLGLVIVMAIGSIKLKADTGSCGGASFTLPFTDVPSSNVFFCAIAEAYFSGITGGITPTTYGPGNPVPREQMAAFASRTLDQSVRRTNRRAALQQFWTIKTESNLGLTSVDFGPLHVQSDGADLWVTNGVSGTVSRVKGSDGKLLGTWGASGAVGVLCAMGKVYVTGPQSNLYQIDPAQSPGVMAPATTSLGNFPQGLAFDGERIWTANASGSVSIVTLGTFSVTTVSTGFGIPNGIIYDGANIWVTDQGDSTIKKLSSTGSILQSVGVGGNPSFPAFDGTNIWVPNNSPSSGTVVRATGPLSGTVLTTLTGNGLNAPLQAAFDGERILITDNQDAVSLWKASDMTPIGTFSTGGNTHPIGACSDGVNFWIVLTTPGKLARF